MGARAVSEAVEVTAVAGAGRMAAVVVSVDEVVALALEGVLRGMVGYAEMEATVMVDQAVVEAKRAASATVGFVATESMEVACMVRAMKAVAVAAMVLGAVAMEVAARVMVGEEREEEQAVAPCTLS